MGIFGRAWKHRLHGWVVAAVRRHLSGGVPIPAGTTGVRRLAGRRGNAAASLVRWDDEPARAIPPRSVGGDLGAFAAAAAMLPGEARRRLVHRLAGSLLQPSTRSFAAALTPARVTHDSAMVLAADGRLLVADVSAVGFRTPLPHNPLRISHLARPRRVPLTVAVVSTGTPWNYFHWMTEALPRLAAYERSGWTVDRVYAPVGEAFQRESLALAGIGPDRILPATRAAHLEAARVLVAPVTAVLSREKLDFLAARLAAALPPDDGPSRRLFITRRGRGPRAIVNEAAVRAVLEPLGFEPRRLESLPLAEQIAAFRRAEFVVAPHGAGLTNLAFCRPGTRVIEIGTPLRPWACFWEIAHHRGLAYHLHLASPVNGRWLDRSAGVGDSDLLVDPASLRDAVERLLSAPAAASVRAA